MPIGHRPSHRIVALLLLAIEDKQGMLMVDLSLKPKAQNDAELRPYCARLLCISTERTREMYFFVWRKQSLEQIITGEYTYIRGNGEIGIGLN